MKTSITETATTYNVYVEQRPFISQTLIGKISKTQFDKDGNPKIEILTTNSFFIKLLKNTAKEISKKP